MVDPLTGRIQDVWANNLSVDDNLEGMNVWNILPLNESTSNHTSGISELPDLEHWNENLIHEVDKASQSLDTASIWNVSSPYQSLKLDGSEFQSAGEIPNGNVFNSDIQEVNDLHQIVKEEYYPTSSVHVPSALPPSTDWAGNYDFDVSFGPQEKTTKGVSWTYSKIRNKLYVGKDVPCPINFSTSKAMTGKVLIRATVHYSSPEHTSEIVERCPTHIKEDNDQGLFDAEHFVRCESNMAHYEIDQLTKHRSVLVPFENPPVGQEYSTYLFKFSCFGSCGGGPNRRSLMIIFKLEQECMDHSYEELGRRRLELKVCACPGRDRKTEEKQAREQNHARSSKRSIDLESMNSTSLFEPKRKRAPVPNDKGYYTISTRDVECYHFLREMKKMHNIHAAFKKLPLETKRALLSQDSQPRSSDPEE